VETYTIEEPTPIGWLDSSFADQYEKSEVVTKTVTNKWGTPVVETYTIEVPEPHKDATCLTKPK
jgi:hypothetical protein